MDPPLPARPSVRVPRVTVCNGKRFFRPSLERAPILGPRNIVSRVQPGTKGKEREKEGEREREGKGGKKNESVQAGRMERREPFDTTRSATKRTCCGRITVHIYLLFRILSAFSARSSRIRSPAISFFYFRWLNTGLSEGKSGFRIRRFK